MPTPTPPPSRRPALTTLPALPAVMQSPGASVGSLQGASLESIAVARELFWQNVLREMLTSLSVLSAAASVAPPPDPTAPPPDNPFDGRLAIITTLGQRIPIGSVQPLFACGIPTSDADKFLSIAVECTVFQISTPNGEVFTLPLHEIRGFHSLSENLIDQIKDASRGNGDDGGTDEPFGFAAYTSLARTNPQPDLPPDPPADSLPAPAPIPPENKSSIERKP